MFRIVQESLGNIHQPSSSNTAVVRLDFDAGTLRNGEIVP